MTEETRLHIPDGDVWRGEADSDGLSIRDLLESPWLGLEPYFDLEWSWDYAEEYADAPVRAYSSEEIAEYESENPIRPPKPPSGYPRNARRFNFPTREERKRESD